MPHARSCAENSAMRWGRFVSQSHRCRCPSGLVTLRMISCSREANEIALERASDMSETKIRRGEPSSQGLWSRLRSRRFRQPRRFRHAPREPHHALEGRREPRVLSALALVQHAGVAGLALRTPVLAAVAAHRRVHGVITPLDAGALHVLLPAVRAGGGRGG